MDLSRIAQDSEENVNFLPLKTTTLSAEMKRKAQDELGETEEKIRHGLQSLRNFIEKEKLPVPEDDYFLMTFLRGRKFRIKDAQDTLRRYVSLQGDIIEAACMDFSVIQKLLGHKIIGILPYRDEEGRAIVFARGGIWTPELCSMDGIRNGILAMLHFTMQYPPTSVCGYVFVIDCGVRSVNEILHYLRTLKYFAFAEVKYPIRIQKIELINENRFVRFAINMVRLILSRKLNERIKLHGTDRDSLIRSIHPSILPEEFGGTLPSISYDYYLDDLKEFLETTKTTLDAIYAQNAPKP